MKYDKEHFCHLLLYYSDSKKRLPKLTDSSQKLILSLLLQLKHVSIDFNDSNVMIFI